MYVMFYFDFSLVFNLETHLLYKYLRKLMLI